MKRADELYDALTHGKTRKCLDLLSDIQIKSQINNIVSTKYQRTCLLEACVLGDALIIQQMIYRGADCSHRDLVGKTPLIIAAENSHTEAVRTLLDEGKAQGCDVNDRDDQGRTALHHTAYNGHTKTMAVLLERTPDINTQNADGETALYVALVSKHVECAKLLVQKGANVNVKRRDEKTPLHAAAMAAVPEGLQLLNGADASAVDSDGNTALHLLLTQQVTHACEDAVVQSCKVLLDFQSDISIVNTFNQSVMNCASSQHESLLMKFLELVIERYFKELCVHIKTGVDEHLDFLKEKGAISNAEHTTLRLSNTHSDNEKAHKLLELIRTNITREKFHWFVESLKDHRNTKNLAELFELE